MCKHSLDLEIATSSHSAMMDSLPDSRVLRRAWLKRGPPCPGDDLGSHRPEKITLIDSRPMKCESFIGRRASEKKKREEKTNKRKNKKYEALNEDWTEVVTDDITAIAEGEGITLSLWEPLTARSLHLQGCSTS